MSELPIVCVTNHQLMIDTFQKDGEAYAGRFQFDEALRILRGAFYIFCVSGQS